MLTTVGTFGPTQGYNLNGYWYGGFEADETSIMTAAAAVSVLAFVFTLIGCFASFGRYWETYERARNALLIFSSGGFWALLSLILYPVASFDEFPLQDNVAWPCMFLALLLLVLLSAKFRAQAKRLGHRACSQRREKRAEDIANGRLTPRGTPSAPSASSFNLGPATAVCPLASMQGPTSSPAEATSGLI